MEAKKNIDVNNFKEKVIFSARRKILFLGAILCLPFGILGLLSSRLDEFFRNLYHIDPTVHFAILVLSGLACGALYYLQYGNKELAESESNNYRFEREIDFLRDEIVRLKQFDSRRELDAKLENLEKLIRNIESNSNNHITDEQRADLISKITEELTSASQSGFFDKHVSELRGVLEEEKKFKSIDRDSSESKSRIINEIRSLRLRANMNLVIGIVITVSGLWLLWDTVKSVSSIELINSISKNSTDVSNMNEHLNILNDNFYKSFFLGFAPRLSLVVFIELFAYFFLGLYKSGLSEIKYFQNELTNIESKLISLKSAITENDFNLKKIILEKLCDTERNYILEKGQTTVELERAKTDGELTKNIIKSVPQFFKGIGKKA